MPPRTLYDPFHTSLQKQILSARFLFLISFISFIISVFYIQNLKREDEVQEVIKNVGKNINYINVYRKPNKLSKDVKYILLWTSNNYSPFYFFESGQRAFVHNNCSVINCYVTNDKQFLNGDVTKFDAIAFNGRNLKEFSPSRLPQNRSLKQKYIYFNLESSDNYPVCSNSYENYFNWTATYKLDSTIPYPYILVKNSDGNVVGPKANMRWIKDEIDSEEDVSPKLKNKTKAVAWFVSNCYDRSERGDFVTAFTNALSPYKLSVDVYGKCGRYTCPMENKKECDAMLERDYYFYLAMENSFAEDYITEKVLTALQNNIVPIVYGASNYSRFLPPDSYLNARSQDVYTLAATVAKLIKSPKLYKRYFRWKRHYHLEDPTATYNVCSVCAALNNQALMKTTSVYNTFRKWWNPEFSKRCWWV